jgi:hypothetical protein
MHYQLHKLSFLSFFSFSFFFNAGFLNLSLEVLIYTMLMIVNGVLWWWWGGGGCC